MDVPAAVIRQSEQRAPAGLSPLHGVYGWVSREVG